MTLGRSMLFDVLEWTATSAMSVPVMKASVSMFSNTYSWPSLSGALVPMIEFGVLLELVRNAYGEVVVDVVDRVVLEAVVALGTNASKLSRVVVCLPFTIRGMMTEIRLAINLVTGTRYTSDCLAGPRDLVYREFPWNSVLMMLYVALYSSVNSTRSGASPTRTVLTLQNTRLFPTVAVMNVVAVDTFNLNVIPLNAMLMSSTLIVKNTLVSGVPHMFFRLVLVVMVMITW